MGALLALAVALVGPAVAPPPNAEVVQLIRDACVVTEMRRDALEQLARSRRWVSVGRRAEGASDEWTDIYRAGNALVVLVRPSTLSDEDRSVGSVCTISVQNPDSGLSAEIEALAEGLGLAAESEPVQMGGEGTRVWSTLGRHSLIYSTAQSGPAVSISLSRQFVTSGSQPTSPPGN